MAFYFQAHHRTKIMKILFNFVCRSLRSFWLRRLPRSTFFIDNLNTS